LLLLLLFPRRAVALENWASWRATRRRKSKNWNQSEVESMEATWTMTLKGRLNGCMGELVTTMLSMMFLWCLEACGSGG